MIVMQQKVETMILFPKKKVKIFQAVVNPKSITILFE